MRTTILLSTLLLLVLAIYSCKKETSLELPKGVIIDSNGIAIDTTGTADSTGTDTTGTINDTLDYQPTSAASYWHYYPDNDQTNLFATMTSTAMDTTIHGDQFHIFIWDVNGQSSEEYISKQNGNYYMRGGSFGASGQQSSYVTSAIGDSVQNLEILYLKSNVPAGTSWLGGDLKYNFDANTSFEDKYTFTIVGRGIDTTINGNHFTNLIHEELSLEVIYNAPGVPFDEIFTYEYYIAANVGIVAFTSPVDNQTNIVLKDYAVN